MRTTSRHATTPLQTSIAETSETRGSSQYTAEQNDVGQPFFTDQAVERKQSLLARSNTSLYAQPDDVGVGYTTVDASEKTAKPLLSPTPSSIEHQASFTDKDEAPPTSPAATKAKPVAWSDLPNKQQLAILTLARLSEPLTQTSLQAYMFYQLRSFDPGLPDSTISSQAGILQGSFTAAQFITAMVWGRIADSDKVGRKRVLLVGLLGTCISCVGFGFSRSFVQAAVFRTLGGALNGNVGVMRTMISEIIKEKKFQSRAFLLLPMCFNIGVIIGPILGGLLSDPVGSYPGVFGAHSIFGGEDGVWWLKHWPYALPNLLSAVFLFMSAMAVILGLEEVIPISVECKSTCRPLTFADT